MAVSHRQNSRRASKNRLESAVRTCDRDSSQSSGEPNFLFFPSQNAKTRCLGGPARDEARVVDEATQRRNLPRFFRKVEKKGVSPTGNERGVQTAKKHLSLSLPRPRKRSEEASFTERGVSNRCRRVRREPSAPYLFWILSGYFPETNLKSARAVGPRVRTFEPRIGVRSESETADYGQRARSRVSERKPLSPRIRERERERERARSCPALSMLRASRTGDGLESLLRSLAFGSLYRGPHVHFERSFNGLRAG